MSELIECARDWTRHDPDPSTVAELLRVVARAEGGSAKAVDDLASRLGGPLSLGTAGLRGPVGSGEPR